MSKSMDFWNQSFFPDLYQGSAKTTTKGSYLDWLEKEKHNIKIRDYIGDLFIGNWSFRNCEHVRVKKIDLLGIKERDYMYSEVYYLETHIDNRIFDSVSDLFGDEGFLSVLDSIVYRMFMKSAVTSEIEHKVALALTAKKLEKSWGQVEVPETPKKARL